MSVPTWSWAIKADRALESAGLLIQDEDFDGAVNRACFAVQYAVCAAIGSVSGALPEGVECNFESVLAKLRKHLLEKKLISREFVDWFEELERLDRRKGTWATWEGRFLPSKLPLARSTKLANSFHNCVT